MGLVISEGLRLKSYNTPAAIAGVAPTLDYRFALDRREIEAISLTDKLTYTGATNGTFVNRSGLIERATTDLPRFDHDPASRQSFGLLVEPSRANLVLRSEEFDNASWTALALNAVSSTNQATAPNGTLTAASIADNGINSIHYLSQSIPVAATTTYTFSCFLRAGTSDFGYLSLSGGAPAWADTFVVSLSTGVGSIQAGSFASTSIQALPNGWYRVAVTKITVGSGSPQVRVGVAQSLSVISYVGSGSTIFAWGAQVEASAFPTSYIPTTTTALTRPVDSAVIDGTGVITGTYTLVEKPAGCAVVNGSNIDLVSGFTAERVMVFPAALSAPQITAIRGAM